MCTEILKVPTVEYQRVFLFLCALFLFSSSFFHSSLSQERRYFVITIIRSMNSPVGFPLPLETRRFWIGAQSRNTLAGPNGNP